MRRDDLAAFALCLAGAALCFLLPLTVSAETSGASPPTDDPVEEAIQALQAADFEALVPILESTVTGDPENLEQPAKAHLLFALGLYFENYDEDAETELGTRADHHIEIALDYDPNLELDPLVYPPRFIAHVETLHRDELTTSGSAQPLENTRIFYFERHVETRSRLPLYLPGGIGQFYNESYFRGATFALLQVLGLATNAAAYWTVESMRQSSGHIPSDDLGRAHRWRRAQMIGIGTFLGGWVLSAVEAHLSFNRQTVQIRSLDAPPAELDPFSHGEVGLQRSILLRWTVPF